MTTKRGAGRLRSCARFLGQRRPLLLVLTGSVGVWIVLARVVMPCLIRSAYRGQGLPILTNLMASRGRSPVEYYLDVWGQLASSVLAIFLILLLAVLVAVRPSLFRRYAGKATPGALGAIRMYVCAILLASALWENVASSALLPREMLGLDGSVKLLSHLPGFGAFLASQTALSIFEALTVVVLFLGVIGWNTRFVIPLGAFCYLLMGGIIREYCWFYHSGLVPGLLLIVLSLTPCGDGWSVDRLLKIARGRPVPAADRALPVYGWSRFLCWLLISLAYAAAGLSKLGNDGLAWLGAAHLKRMMLRDSLNLMEFDWGISVHLAQFPDWFFSTLAVATVVGELSFALVPFSQIARFVVPAAMATMHLGILFLQNIFFPDLIALQLLFYNFTSLRKAIGRWLSRRRGHIEVLYDGLCPLCRRTVRLLAALDLFERLKFLDFRRLDVAEYSRSRGLKVRPEELASQMQVVSQTRVDAGFYGYRTISLALPALWPSVPLLFLPGVPSIGKRVYARMARNRLTLFTCHAECLIESPGEAQAGQVAPSTGAPPGRRYRFAVPAVFAVMLTCWTLRVEFYPLTAMQMYTNWGPVGPFTYFKAFARNESGETLRAPLETAIGALSDSRYRRVIQQAFSPKEVEVCRKYLTAVASAYNSKVSAKRRLTEFELQKWTWDFVSNPADPNHGVLVNRLMFRVETAAAR